MIGRFLCRWGFHDYGPFAGRWHPYGSGLLEMCVRGCGYGRKLNW